MSTYFIVEVRRIKIGQGKDPVERLNSLQTGNSNPLILLATTDNFQEKDLHKRFKKYNIRGEWFNPSPEIINFIKRLGDIKVELSDDEVDAHEDITPTLQPHIKAVKSCNDDLSVLEPK